MPKRLTMVAGTFLCAELEGQFTYIECHLIVCRFYISKLSL